MNIDMCESAHGRAPAVASGIRRVHPDKVVFTYQGDGDPPLSASERSFMPLTAERKSQLSLSTTQYTE